MEEGARARFLLAACDPGLDCIFLSLPAIGHHESTYARGQLQRDIILAHLGGLPCFEVMARFKVFPRLKHKEGLTFPVCGASFFGKTPLGKEQVLACFDPCSPGRKVSPASCPQHVKRATSRGGQYFWHLSAPRKRTGFTNPG